MVSGSKDNNLGSEDNTIRLWDLSTGNEVRYLDGHSNSVKSVAFSTLGDLLASGRRLTDLGSYDP